MYEIRFLEMSQEEFAIHVSPTEALTDREMIRIFQKLYGLDVADLKWKEGRKRYGPVVSFSRFDPGNVGAGWSYGGSSDALTLTVSKAVLFHGVRLFGDTGGSQYEVKFTIKDKTVTGTYTSQQNDGVWSYDVMLTNPTPLLPNEEFTIIATIKGENSCRGNNGKISVKVDNIAVTFKSD